MKEIRIPKNPENMVKAYNMVNISDVPLIVEPQGNWIIIKQAVPENKDKKTKKKNNESEAD